MKKVVIVCSIVALCVLSFGVGYATKDKRDIDTEQESQKAYPLLAKRLFVENPNDIIINFADLRTELSSYLQKNNIQGSLYFEYLPTGTSVRVQGDDELVAASLMKIPVVMELYRAAELGRIDLDKKVSLQREWLDDKFGTLYKKGEGYELSLREAAQIALAESDNTAISAILYSTKDMLKLDENVINSLDVSFERNEELLLSISARSYGSFLKCLYFSCYLNKADSQEILSYLTESTFNNRLRAGIPENVQVAHKIGTFSEQTQSDCGIVYEANRNYLLCVMLNVRNDTDGNKHIADISRITYEYIKKNE
jgi:beta-lactamase class A